MIDRRLVDEAARQQIRRDGLDQTLFVEAGAGTGKTTELVERVVNLVLVEEIPLREIAAITFTEAAAAELRDRLREAFEHHHREGDAAADRQRCADALDDVDIAAISTLHAFALRLLTEHPVEAGLPPRVEVLDEVSSQLAFSERWADFVDSVYGTPELEPLVVRAHALNIRISHDSAASLRDVALAFDQNWDLIEDIEPDRRPLTTLDLAPVRRAIEQVLDLPSKCLAPEECNLIAHVNDIRLELEGVLHGEDDEAVALLGQDTKWTFSQGRKEHWTLEGYGVDQARDALAAAHDARALVVQEATHEVLSRLNAEVAAFTLEAAEARRRDGRLDFHDLLVLARRLLRESPDAREALHQRYRRLLIDEFQDTDPIQLELAEHIAAGRAAPPDGPPQPGRLFFVGDPKQSIYRFRRADISLFLSSRDRLAPDGATELVQNFRSVPDVLRWVNDLFAKVMAEEIPERQPRYAPLHAARTSQPEVDHRPVLLGRGHEKASASRMRELEADDVARVIDDVRNHPERWPVADRRTSQWRAPRLDDVAVLLPTRASLRFLEAALQARSIPFRVDTGSLVYDTQEAREVLSALQAVADPTDEIALVAALRAPMFGCGDDDLFAWQSAGGRWDLRSSPPAGIAGDHPVAGALAYLHELHRQRWWVTPSRLLERLVRERRVLELAFAQKRPRDVWRRLRFLVDQARVFEESQSGDLRAYLAWADLQSLEGARVHQALLPEPDDVSVRILTVHGAKGLEFPIVVASGMTTEANAGGRGSKVHFDEALGPQVKLRKQVQTEHFDRLAQLEDEMDEYEKQRLLYVALTRARDHLVVSAHHRPDRESQGALVWRCCEAGHGDSWRHVDDLPAESVPVEVAVPPIQGHLVIGNGDGREAWWDRRRELLDPQRAARTTSATALAVLEEEDPRAEGDEGQSSFRPPWRRGRAGTAVGLAVHSTLQVLDLDDPHDLDQVAASAALAESVPWAADQVAALARSALDSDAVRRARAAPARWRELYVGAPVEGRTVEGYIDLLIDEGDGLVVVDYKTDAVSTEAEIDAKLDRYRLQGAAYALMLQASTGRPVKECCFVFCREDGAIERTVEDLEAAESLVIDRLKSFSRSRASDSDAYDLENGEGMSGSPTS